MAVTTEPTEPPGITAESLIGDLQRSSPGRCADCGDGVCHHETLMSIAMGFKSAPRCLACLADALGQARLELRNHLHDYIRRRDCYHGAWEWATGVEGFPAGKPPGCLFAQDTARVATAGTAGTPEATGNQVPPTRLAAPEVEWDAGDMACGDLVLELRLRLATMKPQQILRLIAQDTGAREDLPAWCRLTGNLLLQSAHPEYWIQRKG